MKKAIFFQSFKHHLNLMVEVTEELASQGDQTGLLNMEDGQLSVHIHPVRYSPQTFRIRVNTLKSALMAVFLSLSKGVSIDLSLILEGRKILDLSPFPEMPSAL